MFEQIDNSKEWARNKHIAKRCSHCGRDKDPNLLDPEYFECPECQIERRLKPILDKARKHDQEEQDNNKKITGLFDNVIWPE